MDVNDCGVSLQTEVDHANPAAIRLLAEQADSRFRSMLDSIDESYPDIIVSKLSTGVHTSPSDDVIGISLYFSTTGDWDLKPGIWIVGAQIGMDTIGAGTSWYRGIITIKDYPPASIAATPQKITQFARTGYKCGRGSERLNITGVVQTFQEYPDFDVSIAVGGGGPVTVQSSLSWVWAVRIRGNS